MLISSAGREGVQAKEWWENTFVTIEQLSMKMHKPPYTERNTYFHPLHKF